MSGERLKKLRLERGLTQPEVFERTGLSVRTIARVEKSGKMSIDTARTLAKCYGVPIDEVTGAAPIARPVMPPWPQFWASVLEALPKQPSPEFTEQLKLLYRIERDKQQRNG